MESVSTRLGNSEAGKERFNLLIAQALGTIGILIAACGNLNSTAILKDGTQIPQWAVNQNSDQVHGYRESESWIKMGGLLIAGVSLSYAYTESKRIEQVEEEVERQRYSAMQVRYIRETEALQRQIIESEQMLVIGEAIAKLRAEQKADEEIAEILGINVADLRAISTIPVQSQMVPTQAIAREQDTSDPRIPNPPDNPTVHNYLIGVLDAMHKAGYYADYVTAFVGPAFYQFILEMRDPAKLSSAIDKVPDLLHAAMHFNKPPIAANRDGFLSLSVARPDREFRNLDEWIERMPTPKRPSLLLGVDLEEMHHYIHLDGNEMEAVLIGGLPRVAGKTNLIRQMIGFAAENYSQDEIRFLIFDGKGTELQFLKNSPYLTEWPGPANRQVGHTEEDADLQLQWMEAEIENRRSAFAYQGVSGIEDYNRLENVKPEPYIVWILDESHIGFPDMRKENMIENGEPTQVKRLSDVMSIAATFGILVIFSTQAPDRKTIHRQVDAKIGHRIGLLLQRKGDSELVVQVEGCERLLGKGDMLSRRGGEEPVRLQSYGAAKSDLKEWCFPKIAKLTPEQKRERIFELRSKGKDNKQIIRMVWNVTEGDDGWNEASQEFLTMTTADHPEMAGGQFDGDYNDADE